MRVFLCFLIVFLMGAACKAEATDQTPLEEPAKDDMKTSDTIGFGFYLGGFPYGGYYGYPYPSYHAYKKFLKYGYPYYGIRAYPALHVWG